MKYNIIYADPPWMFKVWSRDTGLGRSAESHYSTMTIDDIKSLPVGSIAADNCTLFMWVTMPTLPEGLEVIKAWGFEYKTCAFVWVKNNKKAVETRFWGMGYWTRANAELCLLATRGKPKRISSRVHQIIDTDEDFLRDLLSIPYAPVIESPIEQHSKKPDIVRDKIVELMGDLPRVELFARQKIDGWDVFGNEVEGSITLSSSAS